MHIALLAHRPDLVAQVGELRWREWGYGEESPEAWTATTARESGSADLPMTLVAIEVSSRAIGAVALGASDEALTDEERSGRSPWLLGLVVRADRRHQGVGRRLVAALEDLARQRGFRAIWVATGTSAVGFYRKCGWSDEQELVLAKEGRVNHVLTSTL